MTTVQAEVIRDQLEEKALEYLDLKEQLKNLNGEMQEVSERAEIEQHRIEEGETNRYIIRRTEIERDIYDTKDGIFEVAIQIEVLRRHLKILTGEHIHFRPSFE